MLRSVGRIYLKMMKAIYNNVNACVKSNNGHISDTINVEKGLKQGEPLSPKDK